MKEDTKKLYYIALLPDLKLSRRLTRYQLKLKKEFNITRAMRSPPHITLIPPFLATNITINQIKFQLNNYLQNTAIINLRLGSWKHFKRRTIYLEVLTNFYLSQLKTQLAFCLQNLVQIRTEEKFTPHISLANRDVINFNFIYLKIKQLPIQLQSLAKKIVIFKLNHKRWQEFHTYYLK